MSQPRNSLRGAPATRVHATVPAKLLADVDRLAKSIAGGRSEFVRLALEERVQRLGRRNKQRGAQEDTRCAMGDPQPAGTGSH